MVEKLVERTPQQVEETLDMKQEQKKKAK